ncbi:MAG: 16S rRNA (cytidine(1402)-2'-O)-methyltransferase, partial [Alphaproteobacteria bacterium]|nr:16S rRNA (cytidine(1402)-2'-O)-methyltransferase [Alphaproteobacteria bacterium]
DRFYFGGFLPSSAKKKMDLLTSLQPLTCTMIFYESPKRIVATLAAMATLYPDRQAVLARELTKLHESFYWGSVKSLHDELEHTPLKGELVLVLGPIDDDAPVDDDDLARMLHRALADGMSRRDAVALVASETGHAKKHVYGIALGLSDADRDDDT